METPNLPNNVDPFFYNYQMLIGRWMAPWTNNRIATLYWDPGVGKTRGALAYALMWMRFSSHKKAILLADSDIILRAIQEEVVKYNNFDVELDARTFRMGPKGHGKQIAKTQYIKKQGFEKKTITTFMNEIKAQGDNWPQLLREKYKDYVFIIDEVHTLRRTGDNKVRYQDTITLLDIMRDVSPILLLTATPIVDKWKDLFSLVEMMYPPDVRAQIQSEIDPIPVYTQDPDLIGKATDILSKYAYGLFSSRRSMGVVPRELPIKDQGPLNYTVVVDDQSIVLQENIYPVYMSLFQTGRTETPGVSETEITQRRDIARGEITEEIEMRILQKDSFYSKSRQLYDFSLPFIGGEPMKSINELIVEENRRFIPSARASIVAEDGTVENVFEIYWETDTNGNQIPSRERGLGKYAAKIAEFIRMLQFEPKVRNKFGYVHTLWVKEGVKPIAAALFAAGWEQYTGLETITAPGPRPRFAVIHGKSSDIQISRIIDTANSPANRDGSILAVVIGSRKSGISISFTNARFFIEMSADFNKTTRIQAKGRVFRADSLRWLPVEEREIYTATFVALPYGMDEVDDIQQGIIRNELYPVTVEAVDPITMDVIAETYEFNPATIEINMYYLSEIKHQMAARMLKTVDDISIERIILDSIEQAPENIDNTTHALLYSQSIREGIKASMLLTIPYDWVYPLDQDDMYTMRSAAELISSHTYALTRYGIPRPVNSFSNVISAFNASEHGSQSLSLVYERNFFLVDDNRGYMPTSIREAITIANLAPRTEYEFYVYISRTNIGDIKTILLEIALAMPQGILSPQEISKFEEIRQLILRLYANFWNTYGGGRVVHILWYGIKNNSHLTKLGIYSTPELNTRLLTYDISTNETSNRWKYMDSREREAIYLSDMAKAIQDKEMEAIRNAEPYGYYVHFSVYDGILRVREIYPADWRKSKSFDVSLLDAAEIVASILGTSVEELRATYGNDLVLLRKDVFEEARRLGILIIR